MEEPKNYTELTTAASIDGKLIKVDTRKILYKMYNKFEYMPAGIRFSDYDNKIKDEYDAWWKWNNKRNA